MNNKYFAVNTIALANSLQFLGFRYYVYDDVEYGKKYTFENTEKFQQAYKEICELRKKYMNK